MSDPTSQLRSATRRAKSDVANKLVSMFLHELSRRICREWPLRVDGEEYSTLVRNIFGNHCPYCWRDLTLAVPVIEHLDGMNRYRAGLHIPGNVLVACRKCNNEKRRDDARKELSLADSGWESFLSHDGSKCQQACKTCAYWATILEKPDERRAHMAENIGRIRVFRNSFSDLHHTLPALASTLPEFLAKLYSDCQAFAEGEIRSLLARVDGGGEPVSHPPNISKNSP